MMPHRPKVTPSSRRVRDSADPAVGGTILITGASGGIGGALAARYAAPGRRLLLWGRDDARLLRVAARCRAQGATVRTRLLDLTETGKLAEAILADDEDAPIGLAFLNAGRGDMKEDGRATEDPAHAAAVGLVNFVAPTVLATAIGGRMAARGRGTVVLIGSVAAFHALPIAPTYAASKAGLAHFAEALSIGLGPHGVHVVLISPGFVDTAMSRRLRCAKPFLLSAEGAAARITEAVRRRRRHLILPWPFAVVRAAAGVMPPGVRRAALARLRASSDATNA